MSISNKLEDHIDEPIKKAVAGMSLLGFKTYMSCCGFDYENPKVPKTHLKKAYIFLDTAQIYNNDKLCSLFTRICVRSGWKFNAATDPFLDFYAETWHNDHPWKSPFAVHHYEIFLLAISALNKSIEAQSEHFIKGPVAITDGNKYYVDNVSKFWAYKPTEDWIVSADQWEKMN